MSRTRFIAVFGDGVPKICHCYKTAVALAWKHRGVVAFYDREAPTENIGKLHVPFCGGIVRNFQNGG